MLSPSTASLNPGSCNPNGISPALSDHCVTPSAIDQDGPATKTPALQRIEYSMLKSTMIEVHFQGKPLENEQIWDDWLQQMERKLHSWHERHDEGLSNDRLPGVNFPCALLVAFEAACASARSYREQILSGFFRCPWLDAHNMLEMAMVVLFCLRHGYETISPRFTPQDIFEMTKLFTLNFLSISEHGWTEILKYAGIYEWLLGPLLESVFRHRTEKRMHSPSSFTLTA
ncbi:hypothetical protein VTN00DRAFT_7725 [Thermoascus crustaceus]|uniref:uncharacterized protein n=1 Tax=Thermoascus crustaceus TaxID=5088 RepID=UPI003742EF17